MTRRVRFTPFTSARAFVVAGLAAAAILTPSAARASAVPFAPAAGISNRNGPRAVASADVDRDGDLDLLTCGDGRVGWVENVNGGSAWTDRTIATNAIVCVSVAGADVDGDGDMDVVAAAATAGTTAVFWYENSVGNGSAWVTHTVATGLSLPVSIAAADVDGDGDVDILSVDNSTIRFHDNAAGNGSLWTLRTVSAGLNFGFSVSAADMDRDGDLDVLAESANDFTIAWYENLAGDGTSWLTRTVTTSIQGTRGAVAADLDRDGDLDVVGIQLSPGAVLWYENVAGNGQAWIPHALSTAVDFPASVKTADVDGDGDLDVVTANETSPTDSVRWHENTAGNATSWVTRTVGPTGNTPYDAIVADLDGDGDSDVASVARDGNQIAWFRNQSIHQTACFGSASTIFSTDFPLGSAAADIDRDGDLDVLSASYNSANVTWSRNEGGGAAWTAFPVATRHAAIRVHAADVDGDGDSDVLIGSGAGFQASWAENVNGGAIWSVQTVATGAFVPILDLQGADIDGDGDVDALASGVYGGNLDWYENQNGQGDVWLLHTVATIVQGFFGPQAIDLDRDGDLDILVADSHLVWFQNTAGNGSAWTRRTISTTGAYAAVPLDLDGDGDLDVVGSNVTDSPGMLWHENMSGDATVWMSHSLSTLPDLRSLEVRDVDGDGDLDLVADKGLDQVVWLERTGPGVTFTLHTIATQGNYLGTISSPDLDGDGGPDVLWTSQVGDAVRWSRNGRGQVLLDAADQVPAGLSNGQVFPALRLTVTHGGRAGDSDLELARLGLLFEESPGDPLTSAQANALVEELRVYRDANGNGTFDPGIDVLVATVPTLSLTSGVQTVAFADGDPNVQVAFGTPRTFFVVAQLTANASDQAPNVFRVTHLAVGPSATSAEDRSADIPLASACPADVSTVMIGPILPVELLGFTVE